MKKGAFWISLIILSSLVLAQISLNDADIRKKDDENEEKREIKIVKEIRDRLSERGDYRREVKREFRRSESMDDEKDDNKQERDEDYEAKEKFRTRTVIRAGNLDIETEHKVESDDGRTFVVDRGRKFEIKQHPKIAKYIADKIDPETEKEIELKVKENKLIYKAKAKKEVSLTRGRKIEVETESEVDASSGRLIDVRKKVKIVENGREIEEKEDEILLVENRDIVRIDNVDEDLKKAIRQKLVKDSVEPLISRDKIERLADERPQLREYRFILQIDNSCPDIPEVDVLKKIDIHSFKFLIVKAKLNNLREILQKYDCIIRIGDDEKIDRYLREAQKVVQVETEKEIEEQQYKKTSDDVVDESSLNTYLQEKEWQPSISDNPYKQFITPNNPGVISEVQGLSKEEIYEKAASIVWVSDPVLNGEAEKWLSPEQLLKETPSYATNPAFGKYASDCSEQAHTLVSMLRASGIPPEDIRVAIGKVDFGSGPGGHAWAEIKENGKWMVLEATMGPFYDEARSQVLDRKAPAYNYWKYHKYPVVEVWAYYNDEYFTNEKQEVASGWSSEAETQLDDELQKEIKKSDEQLKEESKSIEAVKEPVISYEGPEITIPKYEIVSFLDRIINFFNNLFG